MTEYYNLPVRFTEEERSRYAAWGMKKEKLLRPYAVIAILIDLVIMACTALYILGLARREGGVYANLVATGAWISAAGETAVAILIFLTIKPVDMLCDKIFKKPQDSRMLRLEPNVLGMEYKLFQGKKVLSSGILLWDEWEEAVDPENNQIWIPDQWLSIGANTIETIYPEKKQHSWMDRPPEKIVGTIKLSEIQRHMRGYLASLEEQKREEEWSRQNQS